MLKRTLAGIKWKRTVGTACALIVAVIAHAHERQGDTLPSMMRFANAHGEVATFNLGGAIDLANPFFRPLGTNGRACVSCHQPRDAWSLTPLHIQQTFFMSNGRDPLFRPIDGAGCPTADTTTFRQRITAYRLLLTKGLIRVEMPIPDDAEFTVAQMENPYGCSDRQHISVYRRPLPSTNTAFLSTVMWDGRQSVAGRSIIDNLEHQAMDATLGHAQADHAPTPEQLQQIVDFETQLFTAQARDWRAGELGGPIVQGGAEHLAQTDFFIGINDPLGHNPSGKPFSSEVFSLFNTWFDANDRGHEPAHAARQAIARGEQLFNTLPIQIKGVNGLNDVPLQDGQVHPVIQGFCGTCHDTPNIGHHSVPAPLNLGLTDVGRRTSDLPLITLINKTTHESIQTSDPGRALVTGKWSDIGKFKGPILRGLAARSPYFHNGSAATLRDVVDFYDSRFELNLSDEQKHDLVAFLGAL
jgi:cytochrome c peroxidase